VPKPETIVHQQETPDTSNPPEALATALFLHRQGLALLPIRPGTKEPHHDVLKAVHGSTEWGPLAHRRASLPEVLAWFQHDPDCQLALIAGPASRNIAVLDIDDLDAAGELLDRLAALGGPVVETPRPGRHFWIRQREPIPNQPLYFRGRKVGELKSGYNRDGKPAAAYVLVPPSLHPDGKPYRWQTRRGLDAPLPKLSTAELFALLDADTATMPAVGFRPSAEPARYAYLRELPSDDSASRLRQLQASPAFVEGALRLLGLGDVKMGRKFCCILPGHEERHPSASIGQQADGAVVYRDWHAPKRGGPQWWTLGEVFAAKVTGQLRELRGRPEHAVWVLRLAIEAGVLEPAKVEAPEPPDDLSPVARKVYEGFLYLLRCKWTYEPAAPTTFSWRFAAGWCGGLGEWQVRTAMRELLQRGLIRVVGQYKGAYGRMQALFMPGLIVRTGGVKAEDKPARRPWTRKAVQNVIRAARVREDRPAAPCAECGGTRFWTVKPRAGGRPLWVCESCLPPPHERVVWCRVSARPRSRDPELAPA